MFLQSAENATQTYHKPSGNICAKQKRFTGPASTLNAVHDVRSPQPPASLPGCRVPARPRGLNGGLRDTFQIRYIGNI